MGIPRSFHKADRVRHQHRRRRRTLGEQEDVRWVGYSWGARRRAWIAATRTAAARIPQPAWAAVAEAVTRRMEGVAGAGRVPRYFSDSTTGRVLSEEERAAENVYIQKMEREKLRKKADRDKADAAKRAAAGKGDKKGEEARPS